MPTRDAVEPQADASLLTGCSLRGPGASVGPEGPSGSSGPIASPAHRHHGTANASATAVHHVIASELKHRNQPSDALAMMVNSMVSMVQAGKSNRSRWSAS